MKTIEQIKNDYAVSKSYKDWEHLRLRNFVYDMQLLERYENEVMKIYARECLKISSEQFKNELSFVKEIITNENNIIK